MKIGPVLMIPLISALFVSLLELHAEDPCGKLPVIEELRVMSFTRTHNIPAFSKMMNTLHGPERESWERAQAFYNESKFQEALAEGEGLLQRQPENIYAIELLARIHYRMNQDYRKRIDLAKPLYEELIQRLQSVEISDDIDPKTVIYYDMVDVYWKLGTLYLDQEKYDRAIVNIYRAMYVFKATNTQNPRAWFQMNLYLVEAFYKTNDKERNNYQYCIFKQSFPSSTEADRYRL